MVPPPPEKLAPSKMAVRAVKRRKEGNFPFAVNKGKSGDQDGKLRVGGQDGMFGP